MPYVPKIAVPQESGASIMSSVKIACGQWSMLAERTRIRTWRSVMFMATRVGCSIEEWLMLAWCAEVL